MRGKKLGEIRKNTWQKGEQLAALHLRKEGYAIVETNWRCKSGELDIIAEYQGTIIFVEVRSQSSAQKYGAPEESVDHRKRLKVQQISQIYLQQKGKGSSMIRFDVISIDLSSKGELLHLRHIQNAF